MDPKLARKRILADHNKIINRTKALAGGIKPSRPHMHGAIEIPKYFEKNKKQGTKKLKAILSKVAGSDYDNTLMGPPVKLVKPDNLVGWANYYAVINDAITTKKIGGKPYGTTRKLNVAARIMHSEVRDLIIARGIEGKIVKRSELLKTI